MKYFIGIDPGLHGGIAILEQSGKPAAVHAMPTLKLGDKDTLDLNEIRDIFRFYDSPTETGNGDVKIVVIEQQRAMPKQGVTSTFTIGKGYGQLMGICAGMSIPYTIVQPREWQKKMFGGMPKGDGKKHSILIARQLFPNTIFKKTPRCTSIHDGMTDAILIAEYARCQ